MGRLLLTDGSSSLLLVKGVDHLLLNDETASGYVNNAGYTPRHERIGRPLPAHLIPQELPRISARISSGQGGQSVRARFEFSVKSFHSSSGSNHPSSGVVEVSVGSRATLNQTQFARCGFQIRITSSVRATQVSPAVTGTAKSELSAVLKSGGEALTVPTYHGEEAFFETVD